MSRLNDLYKAMETLRKEGLALSEEQEKLLSELEERIIKKEILPTLTEQIEPALKQVQRELVLVVDYHPGHPISVALSRRTDIKQLIDAKWLAADPEVPHRDLGPQKNKGPQPTAPCTGLRIHRRDGSILHESKAATTFAIAIAEAGLLQVRALNIRCCGMNLVSTTKDMKYGGTQREMAKGLYVITLSNTKTKQKILEQINKALDMGWTIEIV